MRTAAARQGWKIDTVLVSERQLHVLLAVPAGLSWHLLPRVLLGAVEQTLREARVADASQPIFAERGWCMPLASSVSVTAVRRHLRQRRQ